MAPRYMERMQRQAAAYKTVFGEPSFPPPPYQPSPGQSEASLSTESRRSKQSGPDPPPYSGPLVAPSSRILESNHTPIRDSSLHWRAGGVTSNTTHPATGSLGYVTRVDSQNVALIPSINGEDPTRRTAIMALDALDAAEEQSHESLAPPPYEANPAPAASRNTETPEIQIDHSTQRWYRARKSRFTLNIGLTARRE